MIVVYGNKVDKIFVDYCCYLENVFCKVYKFEGMLVCIEFKIFENLFEGCKL